MKGVEQDLLRMSVEALAEAHERINDLRCDFAVEEVGAGKGDTLGLDAIPEEAVKQKVKDYDANTVLVTEETGKMYSGRQGLEPTQNVLICDPTDRSIMMMRFLKGMILKDPGYSKKYVHEAFKDGLTFWEDGIEVPSEKEEGKTEVIHMGPGPASITGACGSITAIRDRRIIFNVMVNYVTGEVFIADSLGTKAGSIEDYINGRMKSLAFPSERKGQTFVTFLGKSGYEENLRKCNLGLDPADCVDPWTGGPLRVLRLSDMDKSGAAYLISNGEKVCEWMGWLAWAKYARHPVQSDEHAMEAFRLFFESPRTKELVLVAPGPHYSIFADEDGETVINLDRMFQLADPSHYRETLVVTPRHNVGAVARVRSLGAYQQELRL